LPKDDGSLLGFLGAAADMIFGTNEFKWGPGTAGLDYPIIDDDPTTDAPSLSQLLQSVIG
jgi:hypothetical protein